MSHLSYLKAHLELQCRKKSRQQLRAIDQVTFCLTPELCALFLAKLTKARDRSSAWLKLDLSITMHMRLELKLAMDFLLSAEPLSKLIRDQRAHLTIKPRK